MADPVYLSITELPGTGAAAPTVVDFNFAGGYINRTHIKAYILDTTTFARTDVPVLAEHFVTDWRLQLPVSVPVGSVLRVYRDTPKDAPLVDFTNGARINEGNLDLVAQQATFVAAEAADQLAAFGGTAEALEAAAAAAASAAAATAAVATATAAVATAAASAETAAEEAVTAADFAGAAAESAAEAASAVGGLSAALSAPTGAAMVGFIQSGTGAVARTGQDKGREVVSVKDFGAVGEGSENDTAAFDAALTYLKSIAQAGGSTPKKLIVPAGIYNIDRILIQHSNFHMVCEPGAMFKWRGGAGSVYPHFLYPDNLASTDFDDFYKNVVIEGLRIDPATVASGKSVIKIGNMYAGVIRDVHIEDDGFGADQTKLALDIGNGAYKWSIENSTLPRMRVSASSAWNATTIAFRSVGGRTLELKNALGVTCHGLILEGDETAKVTLEEVNGFTCFGGDFEGAGTMYAFVGSGNTNFHSFGNDVTALTGSYTSGQTPVNSYFNDRGHAGFGFPNLNGDAAEMLVRKAGDGRSLRVDSDLYGNLCIDFPVNGYTLIGPADDRISRLVGNAARTPSLSWQDGKLGFFTAGPVAKPTGVPVTAEGIHAALVSLGLIGP